MKTKDLVAMKEELPQAFDEIFNNTKKCLWKALVLKLKAVRKAHKEDNNINDNQDPIKDDENQPLKTNNGKNLT